MSQMMSLQIRCTDSCTSVCRSRDQCCLWTFYADYAPKYRTGNRDIALVFERKVLWGERCVPMFAEKSCHEKRCVSILPRKAQWAEGCVPFFAEKCAGESAACPCLQEQRALGRAFCAHGLRERARWGEHFVSMFAGKARWGELFVSMFAGKARWLRRVLRDHACRESAAGRAVRSRQKSSRQGMR